MPAEGGSAYVIVYDDGGSEFYRHGIPPSSHTPATVFTSLVAAKEAVMKLAEKYPNFTAVAYGSAYPYEDKTFEMVLSQKGVAPIGWTSVEDSSGDEIRLTIALLRVQVA